MVTLEPGLDLPPGRPVLCLQRRLLLVEEVLEARVHGLQHGHCTVLYCTVLYCTVLYCTALYCTVLYCRYGLEGWLADLPPLNVGRRVHGCGGYVSDGEMVSIQ